MANYKKQEVSSRLKKFYSTLSQAVKLADIDNANFMKRTYSSRTSQNYGNWWKGTLGKYMPIEEKDNTTYKVVDMYDTTGGGYTIPSKVYILNDGSLFYLAWRGSNNSTNIFYDINGEKAPNTKGKDIFYFRIQDTRKSTTESSTNKKLFVCVGTNCTGNYSRENLKKSCSYGSCDACSKLIWIDGWEIKDDYPML